MHNEEIVSVCVITYNSENTVTDTLDSILSQNYGCSNIELIISDDFSCDKTFDVINSWLGINAKNFSRCVFQRLTTNVGITKNCNSAWKLATGNWIKTIAGDDLLLDTCILDNMQFVRENSIASVVFSKMQVFSIDEYSIESNLDILPSMFQRKILSGSNQDQLTYLRKAEGFSVAPSAFINRKLLVRIGYGDERFQMIEDYPIWIRILESGEKCYFMDKLTVKYRKSESVSRSVGHIYNIRHVMQRLIIDLELNRNHIGYVIKVRKVISFSILLLIYYFSGAKKNKMSYFFYIIGMIVKPYWLRQKLYDLIRRK
ncbi:glycosyltransferase family 2 protein [Yersinia kristensenii]|uniref:glycosyltransferase family 2 protein n=1 Tax=Yersinia kristensenii TaxID=28152 RepID=UPI0005E95C4A|nr:glycosyltransferase [Yersinia kristensenii]CNH18774.1 glycosyltransferase [Yersinia kristensenii]CNK87365.1 glycosyltransferase [Yersinia kristensenii]